MLKKGSIYCCPNCKKPALQVLKDIQLGQNMYSAQLKSIKRNETLQNGDKMDCEYCDGPLYGLTQPTSWREP